MNNQKDSAKHQQYKYENNLPTAQMYL